MTRPGAIPQYPQRATVRGGSRVHDMSEWEPGRMRCGLATGRYQLSGLPTSCPGCLRARAALQAQAEAMDAEIAANPDKYIGLCLGGGPLYGPGVVASPGRGSRLK